MKLVKIKKGFTLIEVMVTIAILFIVLALVSSILNYNLKLLYTTESKNDLQREAQYAMKCFTQSSMEAQNITVVSDELGNILDNVVSSDDGTSINEIELSTGNRDTSYNGTVSYNFKLNNQTLTYTKKVTTESAISGDFIILQQTSSNIANNVQSLVIKPSTDGVDFKNAIGLIITIKFVKGSQEYNITSNVYFRNSNK